MKKLITWFDDNIFTVLSFFLIVFIPLYPKVPLFELIPGYIVRVRLEDIFILLSVIILIIQVIRKKATLRSVILWPIVIYIIIGLLSTLSAIFITKTVPLSSIHIKKIFLHWFRRIEYLSIFFIFYNGIKNIKNFKNIIYSSIFILAALSIYGYGQKYLYWPVYSTMNREFSKGMRLYLTEFARVPSTFGGHYDLAAFLVIFLTLFIGFFLILKKGIYKWLFLISYLLSYWLLILTASRTSFIAYLAAITGLIMILSLKRSIFWGVKNWFIIMGFSLFIMVSFGDLSSRFSHLFNMPAIKEKLGLNNLLKLKSNPPNNSVGLNEDGKLVMDITDQRPVEEKPGVSSGTEVALPADVYKDIPNGFDLVESATLSGTLEIQPRQRDFSPNAYKYGLSTAIRLDALWPWAIEGFKKNPLLGSGYSTLNKSSIGQFTEAESTDNDYLRTLGETG